MGNATCRKLNFLTLLDAGGRGLSRPPLDVISRHFVGDAPTNSKFLDFSNKHPYFHLVKSFFIFFCNFHQKITVKIFFRPKKERFFHENGQKHIFLTNISIFFQICNQYTSTGSLVLVYSLKRISYFLFAPFPPPDLRFSKVLYYSALRHFGLICVLEKLSKVVKFSIEKLHNAIM